MTAATFFACALAAYSPSLAIFAFHTSRSAQLVIIALFSAFFWLLSALLSSAIWLGISQAVDSLPLTIFYSVLIQEGFRWLFIKSLLRAEAGLHQTTDEPDSPYNRINYALASGLGFGVISGAVSYVSLLSSSWGPGQLFLPSCPQVSLYYITGMCVDIFMSDIKFVLAITTCISILLQIAWTILAIDCYILPNKTATEGAAAITATYNPLQRWLKIGWVVGGHWFCSYTTLFNSSSLPAGCAGGILLPLLYLFVSTWLCFRQLISIKKPGQISTAVSPSLQAINTRQ
jgi:anterior pharynx defective protein 1